MNIHDAVYHGIRHQIRRVLERMTEDQIDAGLTAFEDGASCWSSCFFARAFPQLHLDTVRNPTKTIADFLAIGTNVPVRIVWTLFDGVGKDVFGSMTKEQLRAFIYAARDERRPQEVMDLLKSLNESTIQELANV